MLEAVHLTCQGFSPRTRVDAEVIRFGESWSRTAVVGEQAGVSLAADLTLSRGEGRRARLNGVPLRGAEELRLRMAVLVFTPDRLAIVKGGPAARRAYFDRTLGRIAPTRAALPAEYAASLAQRNAALRRVSAGFSTLQAVEPWTERVASLGAALVSARLELLAELRPRFAERAAELGLSGGSLAYTGEAPTRQLLEARIERDVERGTTGAGPQLDDVTISSGDRELRSFGSQGEQRLAVLALLLAESDLIIEQRGSAPLLLLDDVLSELDRSRRAALLERVGVCGQVLITAASTAGIPADPAQLVEVAPGKAREGSWNG